MKQQFLSKLQKLDDLKLPKDSYAITGSGPLAIRDIREADDIDVLVKGNLWEKLKNSYVPYDEKHIKIENIEIWSDFINLTPILDKVINDAEIIEGYPFVSLNYTISWKKYLGREKDLQDIFLIEEYKKRPLFVIE